MTGTGTAVEPDLSRFATRVSLLCYGKFNTLPKSGKPISGREWTTLAAIVRSDDDCHGDSNTRLKVVSIATGSKCIGKSKLSADGDVINDSHAEVLARRGFLAYLYEQIEHTRRESSSSLFVRTDEHDERLKIREGIGFHLFTSQIPCGDAAIFPQIGVRVEAVDEICVEFTRNVTTAAVLDDSGESTTDIKRSLHARNDDVPTKKLKSGSGGVALEVANRPTCEDPVVDRNNSYGDDEHRQVDARGTGAKCLANEVRQDTRKPGRRYHVVGVVRTKPGRGDPTSSVSCSDKILRWNCVGIQGALLSLLVQPIYLASIIVAAHPSLYSRDAMYRAVVCRTTELVKVRPGGRSSPALLHTDVEFQLCERKCANNAKPSPCSIIWCDVASRNHVVCVQGRRLGSTKKSVRSELLFITKQQLLRTFKLLTSPKYDHLTYYEIKGLASRYQNDWQQFKQLIGNWTRKDPDLLRFV